MPIPLVVGIVFGLGFAAFQGVRMANGTARVARNADGSAFQMWPTLVMFALFWAAIAGGLTWLVMLPF